MKTKILIHSIVFSPDGVSTAYLYNDIALAFQKKGYEVVVLSTTPHYNIVESECEKQPLRKKCLGLYSESDFHGIKVIHVQQKKFKSSLLRMLGFVYWHILSFILGIAERNVKVILSPSPPLTIGFINILLAKLKRCKVVYNVQEIYPDLLIEAGGLKSHFLISILKKLESFVYNSSDKVVTIDSVFYDTIITRFKDRSKLSIIPNFVDTDIYKPIPKGQINSLDSSLFPENDNLKIMYAGNIGHAQDWNPLIQIANALSDFPVEIFIIGEGVMKDYIKGEIKRLQLNNIRLIPYQNRELMPTLLAYSDLQFIFMSPETEGHGFPSKVYTIMACARPVIVASGGNTPIVNFLKDKDCSFLVTSHNADEKIEQIVSIIKNTDREELGRKGANGFNIIESSYNKEVVTEKYINLIESIL